MKRGTDHEWQIVQYKGDIALYARCKCGYRYACSQSKRAPDGTWTFEQEVRWLHNYCPQCGARKLRYNENVVKLDEYPWPTK